MSSFSLSLGSTRYFPAACVQRHRPFLVKVDPDGGEPPPPICPRCGALGRFIPGAYYSGSYRDTIETAIEILDGASLMPELARDYVSRLEDLLPSPTHRALRTTLAESQGLEGLQDLVPPTCAEARELRNFFGLLLSLLSVYIGGTRPSLPEPKLHQ